MGGGAVTPGTGGCGRGALTNTSETVTLGFDGYPMHTVSYPALANDLDEIDEEAVADRAFSLDGAYLAAPASHAPSWCLARDEDVIVRSEDLSRADHGTPGVVNPSCP